MKKFKYLFSALVILALSAPLAAQQHAVCQFDSDSQNIRESFIQDFKTRTAFSYAGMLRWEQKLGKTKLDMDTFLNVRESIKAMAHHNFAEMMNQYQQVYLSALDYNCLGALQAIYVDEVGGQRATYFDTQAKGYFVGSDIRVFKKSSEDFYLLSVRFFANQFGIDLKMNNEQLLKELKQAALEIYAFENADTDSDVPDMSQLQCKQPALFCHYDKYSNVSSYHAPEGAEATQSCACMIPGFLFEARRFPDFDGATKLTGAVRSGKFVEASLQELNDFSGYRGLNADKPTYQLPK